MLRPISKRAYSYTDADFTKLVDGFLNTARRDIVALAAYGITEPWLAELDAANERFAATLADTYYTGKRMTLTYTKNNIRKSILVHSFHILQCAQQAFATDPVHFSYFRNTALSRMPDEDFLRSARLLATSAEEYAAQLSAEGISPAYLAEYRALIVSFNNQMDLHRSSTLDRAVAVHDRIDLGNIVYKMLRKLSAKGKLCFIGSSPARYHHYVIYPR